MRVLALLILNLACAACATLPSLPRRPDFAHDPRIRDPADALATYYHWRLTPNEDGDYNYGKGVITRWRLAEFMDAQGDTVAAHWARGGNAFVAVGWLGALALETAAVCVGAQAAGGDPARNAWWVGLLPAGLFTWTFHGIGDGYFRKPSVAHYDLELKRELNLTKD